MLIQDIATYLQTNNLGTMGTNLFLGTEPDLPDSATTLYDTGGNPAEMRLSDLRRTVQIRVRDMSYSSGETRIWAIYNLLDTPDSRFIVMNGRKTVVRAMQPPVMITRDQNNRCIFVFNIQCVTIRD